MKDHPHFTDRGPLTLTQGVPPAPGYTNKYEPSPSSPSGSAQCSTRQVSQKEYGIGEETVVLLTRPLLRRLGMKINPSTALGAHNQP